MLSLLSANTKIESCFEKLEWKMDYFGFIGLTIWRARHQNWKGGGFRQSLPRLLF